MARMAHSSRLLYFRQSHSNESHFVYNTDHPFASMVNVAFGKALCSARLCSPPDTCASPDPYAPPRVRCSSRAPCGNFLGTNLSAMLLTLDLMR